MKVQYRLLIITALLGLVFLAGFFVVQVNQRNQIAGITESRHAELEPLFNKLLELEEKELSTIVLDYTYWDELVSFVQTKDPKWSKDILESALDSYQINAIWVFDPNMNLVYSITNLASKAAPPISVSDSQLRDLFKNGHTASFAYRLSDGTVMEVRGSTVVPSDDFAHAGPARGYFFAGRAWTGERLAHISDLTGAKVDIIRPDQYRPNVNLSDSLQVFDPILGADGTPIAYIRGGFPNGFMQGFLQAQSRDLVQYLVLTIILLGILGGGLVLWVASPLAQISNALTSGEAGRIVNLTHSSSEFGRIAQLIQEFFLQRFEMASQIEKLKSTESALRESEQRYRTISEITSDATYAFRINQEGQILPEWGAEALLRMTGWPIMELVVNNKILDIVHPEDRSSLSDWEKDLLSGKTIVSEIRLLTPQNEVRWFINHIIPMMDEKSKHLLRIFGAAQDITSQRNAEGAYRTLVEHSLQGLLISQDWTLKFVNPAFVRMIGYSAEELLSFSEEEIDAHIDPDSVNMAIKHLNNLLEMKSETAQFILRARHSDGNWRWLDVVCEMIEYNGRPAIQGSCVDITEHVAAEHALREQTDYSNILFNNVNSLVIILTPGGQITAFNPAAEQICNWGAIDPRGKYLWDLFPIPNSSPLGAENFSQTVQSATLLDEIDLSIDGAGGPHWLTWSQRYKKDQEGNILFVVATAIDITERRIRERQQEALAGIATALRGGATRKETIYTVLEKIRNFVNVDSVGAAFPIAEMDEILIEFVNGNLQPFIEGKRISVNNSISGSTLRTGKPYVSKNIRDEKGMALPELATLVKSIAWIPLISEKKTIGVLMVASKGEISDEDLNLLLPIADMAAGAIDRAERTELAQRRVQQLAALQSINLAIGASLDLRVTLNVLAVQMTTQLGVDAVDVLLLNSQTNQLRYAAGNGFHSREVVEATRLWLGEGQAGRAAMERRSRHLFDPDGIGPYFTPPDFFEAENFVAYDAVPLVVKGEVKGVIETFHRPPYNPSAEWEQLLEALALETAIAIDNAELLAKLQRSKQDLEIAFDATLEGLARMLELYDYETEKHSLRVVDLTVKLAQYLGVSGAQLTNIRRGAYMHDIGKIGIPSDIINKPGKPTPDEWDKIRKHPKNAYDIINPIPFLRPALDIPYGHHERWDGSGVPAAVGWRADSPRGAYFRSCGYLRRADHQAGLS